MSIQPKYDQASAQTNSAQIASSSDLATGDGGVTSISSDAGRNSRSTLLSCGGFRGGAADGCDAVCTACFATWMPTGLLCAPSIVMPALVGCSWRGSSVALMCLHAPEPAIDAAGAGEQRLVGAFFHNRSVLDGDDPIAMPHRRQPVGDDQ